MANRKSKRDLDVRAVLGVKALKLNPTEKLILMMLATESNRHAGHTCFPGQQRLSDLTGLGVRTIRDATKRLAAAGLIAIKERRTQTGYRTSYEYRLLPSALLGLPADSDTEPDCLPANGAVPTGKSQQSLPAANADEGKNSLSSKEKEKQNEGSPAPDASHQDQEPSSGKNKDKTGAVMALRALITSLYQEHFDYTFSPDAKSWQQVYALYERLSEAGVDPAEFVTEIWSGWQSFCVSSHGKPGDWVLKADKHNWKSVPDLPDLLRQDVFSTAVSWLNEPNYDSGFSAVF